MMAKAPDPKQVAAQMAAEQARREAEEHRAAREKLVMWVFVGGERRVLRDVDIKGTHVRMLREQAKTSTNELWSQLVLMALCPLDMVLTAWWLAGLQAGVVEPLDEVLDRSSSDAPWLHYPSDEEIATDDGGDQFDPPA